MYNAYCWIYLPCTMLIYWCTNSSGKCACIVEKIQYEKRVKNLQIQFAQKKNWNIGFWGWNCRKGNLVVLIIYVVTAGDDGHLWVACDLPPSLSSNTPTDNDKMNVFVSPTWHLKQMLRIGLCLSSWTSSLSTSNPPSSWHMLFKRMDLYTSHPLSQGFFFYLFWQISCWGEWSNYHNLVVIRAVKESSGFGKLHVGTQRESNWTILI